MNFPVFPSDASRSAASNLQECRISGAHGCATTRHTRRYARCKGQTQTSPHVPATESRDVVATNQNDTVEETIMSTATIVETDLGLRDAVIRKLDWDPSVDAAPSA